MRTIVAVILWCWILALPSSAQPVRVAVAANAQYVIKVLQKDFEKNTGIKTEIIIASSGKLTAQIKSGAPSDLFLSADMAFPTTLYKAGFGLNPPQVYAYGSLILCSTSKIALTNWQTVLPANNIDKIALANPKLAPYGLAAEKALRHYGLWEKVQSKLIFGESIAQVNTYITTGAVRLGFTSEALLYESPDKKTFNWVRVDSKVYPPIAQGMMVLQHAKKGNYA